LKGQQQDALLAGVGSLDPGDEVAVVGLALGDHEFQVGVGIARGLEAGLGGFDHLGAGAGGGRGIDLDHFLVDRLEGFPAGVGLLGGGGGERRKGDYGNSSQRAHDHFRNRLGKAKGPRPMSWSRP